MWTRTPLRRLPSTPAAFRLFWYLRRAGRLIALWARNPNQIERGGWNEQWLEARCDYDRGKNGRDPARFALHPHSAQWGGGQRRKRASHCGGNGAARRRVFSSARAFGAG